MDRVPIPAPAVLPVRRQPDLVLPPYRYVPGLQPHPWRSPEGHHHGDELPAMDPLWWPGLSWSEHPHFLHACDLFDHRFVWEAHEVWEALWHAVPRPHADRERLQLLIQAAACCLKVHAGQLGPAQTLLRRCRERLERFRPVVVDSERLVGDLEAFIDGAEWPILRSPGL